MRLLRSPLLVPLLALAACGGSGGGGGGGGSAGLLTNQGISAVSLHGQGELWVLEVAEADEGNSDLNGDGDTDDVVPFAYDLADGSLTSLGLDFARTGLVDSRGFPTPFLTVGDVLVAFGVSEAGQGNADRNGDGDQDDVVLAVYDSRTRVTTNTGLAAAALQPAIGLASVAFAVSEAAQGGADLDGSGAADGNVLHVYDSRTGLTRNAQRNVTSELTFRGHAFAFTTDEPSADAELNADGDQLDTHVFQLFDLVTGGIVTVPLAIRGRPLELGVDDWYVLADETQQGAVLNGDGDMDDGVWHFVEPHLGTIQSLDLSSADTFGSSASGDLLALVVQEIDGVDRNGDSDFGDSFVALLEPALAQQSEAFLQSPFTPLVFAGERVAFLLNEVFIGDRNGDNDFQDDIVHTLEASAGAPTSLDLDALSLQAAGERLVFERSEDDDDQVGDDWNGDGDHDDRVLFAWDPLTGLATSTNLASTGGVVAASSAALLLVGSELGQHQDLNGDGDQNDLAWVLHELASGTNVNLGGAALVSPAGLLEDGRGLVLVFEGFQGRDLNGDRDVADLVLHTFVAP